MKQTNLPQSANATLTRRTALLAAGAAVAVSPGLLTGVEQQDDGPRLPEQSREPWLTAPADFRDVSRGRPVPHKLSNEKKSAVGMTRETWQLNVVADQDVEPKAIIGNPMTQQDGNAFDFAALMKLAETRAVRFPKVMTCLNIGCPLGMGIWEGVPLRDVLWLAKPAENIRRVFFYGYHNDVPEQRFQSSLPVGRVLEDPFGLPPVILCYKLNGEWLSSERGGPVRIVVPEAYGFKSIKWLSDVVISNISHANDTYAKGNNDLDSLLKTFAATISVPDEVSANQPIPITGYAQAGIAGLSKVQVWISPAAEKWPTDDPYFETAPWVDATILPAPSDWGGIANGLIPPDTMGFDSDGRPQTWPMRLCKALWTISLPGLPAGDYRLRSRTVDANGIAQPMPRPFRKSGHAAIESVRMSVTGCW
jgi:DMSO/TMAO reductase YedYZ molybdopterin-dependent catalytic subunit